MTEGVVDRLEAIDVAQEPGHRSAVETSFVGVDGKQPLGLQSITDTVQRMSDEEPLEFLIGLAECDDGTGDLVPRLPKLVLCPLTLADVTGDTEDCIDAAFRPSIGITGASLQMVEPSLQ